MEYQQRGGEKLIRRDEVFPEYWIERLSDDQVLLSSKLGYFGIKAGMYLGIVNMDINDVLVESISVTMFRMQMLSIQYYGSQSVLHLLYGI